MGDFKARHNSPSHLPARYTSRSLFLFFLHSKDFSYSRFLSLQVTATYPELLKYAMKQSGDAWKRGTLGSQEDSRGTGVRGTPGSAGVRGTPGSAVVRDTPGTPGVGRIRKNTHSNHNLRRSSHILPDNNHSSNNTDTDDSASNSRADDFSEYLDSTQNIRQRHTAQPPRCTSSTSPLSTLSNTLSAECLTRPNSHSPLPLPALNINDIRELLQSHEEGIINHVVLQLNSSN